MKQSRSLPFVLAVLDDGLRLYRQHFSRFVLLAAMLLVPFMVLALLTLGAVESEFGTGGDWLLLLFGVAVLIGYPLMLYFFAAMSRTTAALLDGQPLSLWAAIRIGPVRGCGIVGWSLLFGLATSLIFGMVSAFFQCLIFFMFGALGAAVSGISGDLGIGGVFGFSFSLLGLLWIFVVLLGQGLLLTSNIYVLQPLVLERRSWGAAVSRSLDLLLPGFGRNLLVFTSASAVLIGFVGAVIGTLAALLNLVSMLVLQDSSIVPDVAVGLFFILVGAGTLVVCLPAISIWMTLLFRRVAAERDGVDLATKIEHML